MSINNITSFKAQDFNTLIAEAPANSAAPIAARPIEPDTYEKSEGSAGKTIAKTLIGAGILAATLGLLRGKVQCFKDIDLTKGTADLNFSGKMKYYVAKAGDFVNEYASKAWNGIKKLFGKGEDAAKKAENAE